MEQSIHELVTAERVCAKSGHESSAVARVLAAQRQAINVARAANHVVLMPAVTFHHRGDPLGLWCQDHIEDIFSAENIERVRPTYEADDTLVAGTVLVSGAGCPVDHLRDSSGQREVWTLHDLEPLIVQLAKISGDQAEDLVASVLDAFWELASEEGTRVRWVWPYERVALERKIEDWLEANLDTFSRFGLSVRVAEPGGGTAGRQWRTSDGGRLDLLLEVTQDGSTLVDGVDGDLELVFCTGDLVVVELKAVPLDSDSVRQIRRYISAVEEELAQGRMVWGMLIGSGADESLFSELDEGDDVIMTLWLSQIGFTKQFLGDRAEL